MMGKKMKRGIALGLSVAMAACMLPTAPVSGANLSEEASAKPFMDHAGSMSIRDEWTTYDEPFYRYTAGSQRFRIPILITLQDGTLLAAADARWETNGDGGGLDSIASISKDGGKTWQYSFPLYFPDSDAYAGEAATTIIDPGVVEGPDGTIYFIADVNPTGSTTAYKDIPEGTGYVEVDNGVDEGRFLALADDFEVSFNTRPLDDNLTTYPYYISELDENFHAEIRNRIDGSSTGYGVDEWYNLYSVKENGEFVNDLERSHQVNGAKQEIQQNCFYKDSMFHVYSIDYLWVITSKDGGKTWEHPRDLTDQIKREGEHALLVSPGQGISTSKGDIVIGFYDHGGDEENASFVYSTDNGENWQRTEDVQRTEDGGFWTSENEIVELWDGTLRMFLRNAQGQLCYADAVKNSEGKYEVLPSVRTGIPSLNTWNGCNLSAISYSQPVNGKQMLLVTTPTGTSRANGKIFALLVEEDNTVSLLDTFEIPGAKDGYVYSCITEMQDGTIALLWEPNKWPTDSIYFSKFSVLDIAPHATVESVPVNVEIGKGETYTRTYAGEGACSITKQADAKIAEVKTENDGENKIVTILGKEIGYTETVIDNVTYKIKVSNNTIYLDKENGTYQIENVENLPEVDENEPISITASGEDVGMLCDHQSNTNNSLSSFSGEANKEISIADAEFTFTKSGSNWKIYNETTNQYLANGNAASYFQSAEANMMVTFTQNQEVRICRENGERYLMFYYNNMDFNGNNGGYNDNMTNGSQELVLFEKKASVSEDDIIPGYARASEVKGGKKYLIGYIWSDGSVIVLYPKNGTANQTKLVKKTSVYTLQITPKKFGEIGINVDGKIYYFKVTEACNHSTTEKRGEIPASCMEEGYTGDTYCANPNCGQLIQEGTSIAAIGSHDWGEPQITKQVTKTEDGETVAVCKRDSMHKKTSVIYASDYLPLKEQYDKVAEILENMVGYYKEDEIEDLKTIFEKQKAAVENFDAQRSEIISGTAALKAALQALKSKVEEQLQAGINAWKTERETGESKYTPESFKVFSAAYDKALNAPADADADTLGQLLTDLQTAYSGLKAATKKEELKVGDTVTVNGVIYKVTNAAGRTAEVAGGTSATITILSNVTIKDVNLTVTAVGEKAFLNSKTVKKVVIGSNVTSIGKEAFSGCRKLTSVTIGADVKSIEKKAFYNCKKLKKLILNCKNLKKVQKTAFKKTAASKVTVKMPKGLKEKQRKAMFNKLKKAGVSKKAKMK